MRRIAGGELLNVNDPQHGTTFNSISMAGEEQVLYCFCGGA